MAPAAPRLALLSMSRPCSFLLFRVCPKFSSLLPDNLKSLSDFPACSEYKGSVQPEDRISVSYKT